MSYNPAEPTPLDVIRGWSGDTSNDPATEIVKDETILSILVRFGVGSAVGDPIDTAPFYRSAAETLRRVAVVLQSKPSSISAPADGSISWASRTKALEDKAKELDALADAIEAGTGNDSEIGKVVTIYAPYMAGEWDEWGETW